MRNGTLMLRKNTLPLTKKHHQSFLEQTVLSQTHLFIISVYTM